MRNECSGCCGWGFYLCTISTFISSLVASDYQSLPVESIRLDWNITKPSTSYESNKLNFLLWTREAWKRHRKSHFIQNSRKMGITIALKWCLLYALCFPIVSSLLIWAWKSNVLENKPPSIFAVDINCVNLVGNLSAFPITLNNG